MPVRVARNKVRSFVAVSLRFPGAGNSAQGQSVPKTRPKGVADGWQANIPALPQIDVMGGQGSKDLPTAGLVGESPRVAHR